MTPDSDPPPPMHLSIKLEDGFFLGFVLLVSVAFALVIEPFFAAILWGVIVAIVFAPVHKAILATMPRRTNAAALLTLLAVRRRRV